MSFFNASRSKKKVCHRHSTKTGHPAAVRTTNGAVLENSRFRKERTYSKIVRGGRTGVVGGLGCGGRRLMVRRDCAVSARTSVPWILQECVEADSTLELHLGLQRSACIRDVPVGAPTNPWHRKLVPVSERGAPRRKVCVRGATGS